MIAEKIKQDVDNEFAQLEKELHQTDLKGDFDPSEVKAYLREYVPEQIQSKSGMGYTAELSHGRRAEED